MPPPCRARRVTARVARWCSRGVSVPLCGIERRGACVRGGRRGAGGRGCASCRRSRVALCGAGRCALPAALGVVYCARCGDRVRDAARKMEETRGQRRRRRRAARASGGQLPRRAPGWVLRWCEEAIAAALLRMRCCENGTVMPEGGVTTSHRQEGSLLLLRPHGEDLKDVTKKNVPLRHKAVSSTSGRVERLAEARKALALPPPLGCVVGIGLRRTAPLRRSQVGAREMPTRSRGVDDRRVNGF